MVGGQPPARLVLAGRWALRGKPAEFPNRWELFDLRIWSLVTNRMYDIPSRAFRNRRTNRSPALASSSLIGTDAKSMWFFRCFQKRSDEVVYVCIGAGERDAGPYHVVDGGVDDPPGNGFLRQAVSASVYSSWISDQLRSCLRPLMVCQ